MKNKIWLLAALLLAVAPLWADQWQTVTPVGNVPVARSGHSMVFISNKVYLYGGFSGTRSSLDTLHLYSAELLEWTEEEPENTPPPARFGHQAVVYNNKMYVFFGYDNDGNVLDDVWCYDPQTKTWNPVPCGQLKPPARAFHSATLVGNMIWIFGGYDSNHQTLGDLWAYNFVNAQWRQYQVNADAKRSSHSAVGTGNSIIFYGGYNDNYLGDMWEYEIGSATWRTVTAGGDHPGNLAFQASTTYGSKLWIMGGYGSAGANNKTFEFDTQTFQWVEKSTGPYLVESAVVPMTFAQTRDEESRLNFFVFGGSVNNIPVNDTWYYVSDEVGPNPPPPPPPPVTDKAIVAKIGALGKATFGLYVLKFDQDQETVKVDVAWDQDQAKLKLYTLRIPCNHLANHPLAQLEDNWEKIGLQHLMHFNREKSAITTTRGEAISVTLPMVRQGYLLLLLTHNLFSKTARDISFNVSEFKQLPKCISYVFFVGDPNAKAQQQTTSIKLPVTPAPWHSHYPSGTNGDETFGTVDETWWQWQFVDRTPRLKFLPAHVRFLLP